VADQGAGFSMTELTGWSLIQLDLRAAALAAVAAALAGIFDASCPARVGDVGSNGAIHIMRTGPRRLWIVLEPGAPVAPLESLGTQAAVTTLTHGQRRYRLSGSRAREVLARCVALDFDDPAFAPGRIAQTQLHRVPVLLHRLGETAFNLHLPRSFAQSLEEWIADAARLAPSDGNRGVGARSVC